MTVVKINAITVLAASGPGPPPVGVHSEVWSYAPAGGSGPARR